MPQRPTDPFHDPAICPWCPDAAAATTPAAPIDTSQDDPPMNHPTPTHIDRTAEVLLEHGRTRIQDCRCGWADLGRSHTEHVAHALAAAGLLADDADRIGRAS